MPPRPLHIKHTTTQESLSTIKMALVLARTFPRVIGLTDLCPELLLAIDNDLDNNSRVCFGLAFKPYYCLITKIEPLRSLMPPDPRSGWYRPYLYGTTEYETLCRRLVLYLPKEVLKNMVKANIIDPFETAEGKEQTEWYEAKGFDGQWMFAKKALERRLA